MLLVESQNPVPVRLQIRSITVSPPPIFALPESAAGNR